MQNTSLAGQIQEFAARLNLSTTCCSTTWGRG
jgi:hypothetical protein